MSSLYRSIAFAHHGYRHFLADASVDANLDPLPARALEGCECVVTGANRGLGLEVARAGSGSRFASTDASARKCR